MKGFKKEASGLLWTAAANIILYKYKGQPW